MDDATDVIDGSALVAGVPVRRSSNVRAVEAATGLAFGPEVTESTTDDIDAAAHAAWAAFDAFRETAAEARAAFLEAIAERIDALGNALTEVAMRETGLPRARLEGERGRTVGQLRLFAKVVRDGDWQGFVVDGPLPERQPLPRPDLRVRNVALGPVAVFGASNFPLAFSVAGGDTASALAAGCPVLVKGHPGHPGTGELVARAVTAAVRDCGLPAGVFSFLPGAGHAVGEALVRHPQVKAVGFTGSRAGGVALLNIANARPEPIPVYAEMSSINPVVLMPHALSRRADALAEAFVASLTMGSGQFCTSPGLLIGIASEALERFREEAARRIAHAEPGQLLNAAISDAYGRGIDALIDTGIHLTAQGRPAGGTNRAVPHLFATDADSFRIDLRLAHEVFGPSALLVTCRDLDDVRALLEGLEGQLTATLQLDDEDVPTARALLPTLERKAGRILVNGWPTGVEVGHAMVHGGPYPATSDSRTTSVGAAAIARFLRPVCYQNLPEALLPGPLQEASLSLAPHRRDGELRLAGPR